MPAYFKRFQVKFKRRRGRASELDTYLANIYLVPRRLKDLCAMLLERGFKGSEALAIFLIFLVFGNMVPYRRKVGIAGPEEVQGKNIESLRLQIEYDDKLLKLIDSNVIPAVKQN
ncbi:hypothetical protein C5167_023805 [Papaver somniferum]|uniref:Uncharacterized protein n=1 Tax=Papaver somniferum TaxID=3469 RepID=A0A4Y7JQT9_PAPSO|nr:hypothetical protein C5167_023805 [Papaver somniferum]